MTDENEILRTGHTLADVATDEDKLFRDGFVTGISEFIKECPTPMTIAIQGDWGAGKTSLINLIEAELRVETEPDEDDGLQARKYCEDIISVVTVDAWQQLITNPRIGLFEILLSETVLCLRGSSLSGVKGASEFASAAVSIAGAVLGDRIRTEDDSSYGSIFDFLFGSGDNEKSATSQSDEGFISAEDVKEFQTSFVEEMRQSASDNGKSEDARFVVFVDGLDCINPENAIDLMEKIKTFIECPHCVFVLALDESVVLEGARKKLGDKVDEGRKKMLFDRYIQVPLHIPADAYNLEKYVKDLLKDEKETSGELAKVISVLLSGPTPRRIKRCINAMHLYLSIFGGSESVGDSSLAMLLAATILKVESIKGFGTVANCAKGDEEHFTENLKAALESLGFSDGISWAMLPTLWSDREGVDEDVAKRNAFLSWIRKLK